MCTYRDSIDEMFANEADKMPLKPLEVKLLSLKIKELFMFLADNFNEEEILLQDNLQRNDPRGQ